MEKVVKSQTACYVGCFTQDYHDMISHDTETMPAYYPTGVAPSCLSNRVSWFYDLHGPSMTVDTACSSSLIALHLACQSLRDGESDMSLVGGVNFMCTPEYNFTMSALHFLTPDGKCQSFDEKGNGYARGEGAAFLVIKPLVNALRDNDVIRAVVRNTGTNQDGNTPGITLPSSDAQAKLIRNTYARAGLDMADTGYFEAHGTGTAAGDPIETSALGATIGKARPAGMPLWVGSVKANIGHLEGASGLAGLVKAIHVIEKGYIPPQVWLETLNPRILADEWNLAFPRELTPWPYEGLRRVSINSFGFGGANAHCILDDAYHYLKQRGLSGNHTTIVNTSAGTSTPDSTSSGDSAISMSTPPAHEDSAFSSLQVWQALQAKLSEASPKLAVFSSHEQSGIARTTAVMRDYLQAKKDAFGQTRQQDLLSRFAYTLGTRRSVLPWKSYVVASSLTDACEQLEQVPKPLRSSKAPKIGFVFTGQGAQHFAMGRELWAYSIYADSLNEADAYLRSLGCNWSVVEELFRDAENSRIDLPEFSQPLCTAVQIGLVDLLKRWGISPSAVVGHSSGEIAAAYAKGAISKEDAWTIAYHRGRLSAKIKELAPALDGAMLAAGVGPEAAQKYIEKATTGKASVACINSPSSVTISGDRKAILEIEEAMVADDLFARKLKVKTAYHSFQMEAISKLYLESLADIKPNEETAGMAKMFSSVTGSLIPSSDLGAQYWVDNMLNTVQFSDAVDNLMTHSETRRRRAGGKPFVDILLECGPHGALQGPIKQILGERIKNCTVMSALSRGKNCVQSTLETAGSLFQLGCNIDLNCVNSLGSTLRKQQILTDMPAYTWNHTNKYWSESAVGAAHRFRELPRNDLLGTLNAELNTEMPSWRHFFRLSENPWIEDHSVHNTLLYPAAGMMCMALEAASQIADHSKTIEGYELKDVLVGNALIVPRDDNGVETQLHLQPWRMGSQARTTAWNEFTIYSRPGNEEWSLNCSGLLRVVYKPNDANPSFTNETEIKKAAHREAYKHARAVSTTPESATHFYDHQRKIGLQLGVTFRNLFEINKGDGQSACLVRIPDMASTMPMNYITPHVIHPCTLDAIIQTLLPTVEGQYENLKTAAIPTFIESLFVSSEIPSEPGTVFRTYSVAGYTGLKEAEASVYASTDGWSKPLVAFERIRATRLSAMTDGVNGAAETQNLRKITGEFVWKELVSSMSPEQITSLCSSLAPPYLSEPTLNPIHLDQATMVYAKKALQHCSRAASTDRAPQLKNIIATLELIEKSTSSEEQASLAKTHMEEAKLLGAVAAGSVEGQLLSRLGRKLPEILDGQLLAFEVVSEDDLLPRYARHGHGKPFALAQFSAYMSLLGHETPGMKILELGCKTAAVTESAMNLLFQADDATPWFKSYTCAGEAREPSKDLASVLDAHAQHTNYKQLDICAKPVEQGFKEADYDVVVAPYLSQTADLLSALKNIKALLRPGGKLILGENIRESVWFSMITSALGDGTMKRMLSEAEWTKVLREAGFDGVEFRLPDATNAEENFFCFLVSTSTQPPQKSIPADTIIIEPKTRSSRLKSLSAQLADHMRSQDSNVFVTDLDGVGDLDLADKSCIVLAEAESPLLFELRPQEFDAIRDVMLDSGSTTWITRGGAMECRDPKSALITGLSRTIRQENAGIKLATLDLDSSVDLDAAVNVEAIVKAVVSHSLDRTDQEFASRDGNLYVPRVHLNKGANDLIATFHCEPTPEPGYFKQIDRALTLTVEVPGMLDTLYFKDDETWALPMKATEVEIEVKASGLNFMDVMVAMDQIQEPAIGLECSGVVTRTGSSTSTFKVGDRVMTWLLGGFSNYARNDQSMFQRIPDDMSFETAASLPMIYCTAYSSLIDEARLTSEDTILIHAAAGGVGQAAIMIAQQVGAEIYATVGSQQKKDHIMKAYGIPEDHIFNSRDLSFATGIKRMTNGKGVDVVLNSLAGEALRESWNCLAWFGRFIELGKKDISKSQNSCMPQIDTDHIPQLETLALRCLHSYETSASTASMLLVHCV